MTAAPRPADTPEPITLNDLLVVGQKAAIAVLKSQRDVALADCDDLRRALAAAEATTQRLRHALGLVKVAMVEPGLLATDLDLEAVVTAALLDVGGAGPGRASIVHLCPPDGSGLMPCCGRTPFEAPATDRMTQDAALVTCRGASTKEGHE